MTNESTRTRTFSDEAINAVASYFTITDDEAEVFLTILDDAEGENLDNQIEEWKQEKIEELTEEATEADEPFILTDSDVQEKIEEHVEGEIEAYLSDFTINEGRGHTGNVTEIEYGNREYCFCGENDAEEEAIARLDDLVDEMLHDADWVRQHVVSSWERGETREEWVKSAVNADGVAHTLGTYDGSADDVTVGIPGQKVIYTWWRHN